MKLDFKQPKYILPLLALPFLCLFFYVWHSGAAKHGSENKNVAGLNGSVADVSPDVKKRRLEDKLDAYRNRYKESDGSSPVMPLMPEKPGGGGMTLSPASQKQRTLDSIDSVMKRRFTAPGLRAPPELPDKPQGRDRQLADALSKLYSHHAEGTASTGAPGQSEKDPMELFKQQMAYMDSMRMHSDPAWQKQQQEAKAKAEAKQGDEMALAVSRDLEAGNGFNTVRPTVPQEFITAVIDENITGYAGSRIRLKLLEPIKAGTISIPKGSYLYALITGFSAQRVEFSIKTIMYAGHLLPVKLSVYDQDGLPGLYVPGSQFRDFTKDLGTNSIQGVSIDNGSSSGSQFLMSTADKLFQSTSSAIASAIRKNKAKIKFNSYIYLIDTKNPNP
ncbi:MAG: conjugative transposon protein TraM [Bacteroidetes bacterium]|nr:conjugative transposon protein TraM [Bacteroidota bacterium]